MSDSFQLALAAGCGLLIGMLYFSALWLTVTRLPNARSPEMLMLFSVAARMGLALSAFWLVMAGRWERAVACLFGFIAARILLMVFLKRDLQEKTHGRNSDQS